MFLFSCSTLNYWSKSKLYFDTGVQRWTLFSDVYLDSKKQATMKQYNLLCTLIKLINVSVNVVACEKASLQVMTTKV